MPCVSYTTAIQLSPTDIRSLCLTWFGTCCVCHGPMETQRSRPCAFRLSFAALHVSTVSSIDFSFRFTVPVRLCLLRPHTADCAANVSRIGICCLSATDRARFVSYIRIPLVERDSRDVSKKLKGTCRRRNTVQLASMSTNCGSKSELGIEDERVHRSTGYALENRKFGTPVRPPCNVVVDQSLGW